MPSFWKSLLCNKKNHFKVCCQRVGKKVHKIEKDESQGPFDQSYYELFIETINIQNSAYINQIKNENSDWSRNLPSNGIPISYKIDNGTQSNVIPLRILKNFDPEPDLCPVKVNYPHIIILKFLHLEIVHLL